MSFHSRRSPHRPTHSENVREWVVADVSLSGIIGCYPMDNGKLFFNRFCGFWVPGAKVIRLLKSISIITFAPSTYHFRYIVVYKQVQIKTSIRIFLNAIAYP